MMKKLFILLTAALMAGQAYSQTQWVVDKAHSEIGFSVVHMVISEVQGLFTDYDATIYADKEDFSDIRAEVRIKAASISTGNERRDNHLRSDDFFAVEEYPEILFKSTSMSKTGENTYKLSGDLTMRGVTRKVTFDVKLNGIIKDPYGNTRAGFNLSSAVNRKDFGLTWNNTLESGGVVVSDEVKIEVHTELIRKK